MNKKEILEFFFWEIFFFSLTLAIGLFSALEIQRFLKSEKIILHTVSFGNFFSYFLFATLIVLLLVYLPKIKRFRGSIYKLFFIFTSIYGTLTVLSLFLPDIFTILATIILIYWWLKFPTVIIHDLLMVLGMAGIGAMLGLSLEPKIVVLLLLVLSVYDFIAVYKTKHMITMAKSMLESGVIMGIVVPSAVSGFRKGIKEVKPGGEFVILGGGDIVFPLLLSVSLISQGIPH